MPACSRVDVIIFLSGFARVLAGLIAAQPIWPVIPDLPIAPTGLDIIRLQVIPLGKAPYAAVLRATAMREDLVGRAGIGP